MKNKDSKKSIALTAIAAGTVAIGSIAGAGDANATNLFSFENLGSGSELRSELLIANDATSFIQNNEMELKCGEGEKKAAAKDGAKAAEHKCGEGKCGEGKCGEGKKAKKATKDAGEKTAEKKEEVKKEAKEAVKTEDDEE